MGEQALVWSVLVHLSCYLLQCSSSTLARISCHHHQTSTPSQARQLRAPQQRNQKCWILRWRNLITLDQPSANRAASERIFLCPSLDDVHCSTEVRNIVNRTGFTKVTFTTTSNAKAKVRYVFKLVSRSCKSWLIPSCSMAIATVFTKIRVIKMRVNHGLSTTAAEAIVIHDGFDSICFCAFPTRLRAWTSL